jgi:hypothetical protein
MAQLDHGNTGVFPASRAVQGKTQEEKEQRDAPGYVKYQHFL